MTGARAIPQEVTGNMPLITMTGMGRFLIEQHRGVTSFQDGRICFSTAAGDIVVSGENLRLSSYTAHEALVCGRIMSVSCTPAGGVK